MNRVSALLIESIRVAWVTRVTSALILLLAAALPAITLGTVGLSIEAQRSILRRVDEAGSRIVTMTTTGGSSAAIPAPTVERAASLEGVSWVLGLGPVFDGRNRASTGGPTPVRAFRAVGLQCRSCRPSHSGPRMSPRPPPPVWGSQAPSPWWIRVHIRSPGGSTHRIHWAR